MMMRNIKWFAAALLTMLLIASCTNNASTESEAALPAPSSEAQSQAEFHLSAQKTINLSQVGKKLSLQSTQDQEIHLLYISGDWILYEQDGAYHEQDDTGDNHLFAYDIKTETSTPITTIEHYKHSSVSITERNGKVYYPFASIQNDQLQDYMLEIDKQTLQTQLIRCEDSLSPLVYLKATERGILRGYQIEKGKDTIAYHIDLIDVDHQNQATNIIQFLFDENKRVGEASLAFDVDASSIYCHVTVLQEDSTLEMVRSYSFEGVQQQEYPLDLDAFLDLSEQKDGTGDVDSIFTLIKANDYFLFTTLNSRMCIVKQHGNDQPTTQIPLPDRADVLGYGAGLLEQHGVDPSHVYFMTSEAPLYRFHSMDATFSQLSFTANEGKITGALRDVNGNLLVRIAGDTDEVDSVYYFLSSDAIS